MGEAGFFAGCGRGEVAHQIGGRALQLAVGQAAAAFIVVHPCAAAFAFAGVQIHIHAADVRAVLRELEITHVRMPNGYSFFGKIHAVEPFDLGEQAEEHFAHGEVFFHFGFAERIFGLAQFFGGVGQIPGLRVFDGEGVAGEGLHGGKVLLGEGLGAFGQIAQEVQHLRR